MRLRDPKRLMAFVLSFLVGTIVLVSSVQPLPFVADLLRLAQIMVAVALVIGLGNVVLVQARGLRMRLPGLGYRLVLVGAAVAVLVLELIAPLADGDAGAFATRISDNVFQYVYQPTTMSVLALLAFFALRAAWRAFAVRPGEATIVVVVAALFLIGSGPWATLIPGLSDTLVWITTYPANGVARGILIGISIGAVVATVRLLLGFDQPYLDR